VSEMKQHLFALTRSEQRVVILALLLAIGGVAGKRFYDIRQRPPLQPVSAETSPAPSVSREEEEPGPAE